MTTDDDIPEQEAPSNKTSVAPKKSSHSSKFNVIRPEKRVSASFSILAKLFTIGAIIVASLFIFANSETTVMPSAK